MRIGIPKESMSGETLVASTPKTIEKLKKLGFEIIVETGAGDKASYPDSTYKEVATIGSKEDVFASDIVVKINQPTDEEVQLLKEGSYLVSKLAPSNNSELLEKLSEKSVTALAIDTVPRISRAQSMDILSSQANLAGYRAIIEAANVFGRLLSGQVTAAGKMAPARVYVIGAGIAGLAAIGTAVSMGAQVFASDVRPEVAEQVNSMGATFIPLIENAEVSTDGYAKEMSQNQQEVAAKIYDEQVSQSDIVITTALIPGRPAPRLVSRETLEKMKPGSVVVDMAAITGGNVELSKADETVVTNNGVTILGITNLTSRLATQASELFGNNIANLFKLLTPNKDGEVNIDFEDVIVRSITVTKDKDITWPPPPVQVSAAPQPETKKEPNTKALSEADKKKIAKKISIAKLISALIASGILLQIGVFAGLEMVKLLTIFALAIFVGYYVISNVTHALHTPLMSVTNAISGIVLIGAILQIGSTNIFVTVLSFIAIVIASINIFGGFLVTDRMLKMFRKED
ncbi:Re/Si-specific NAD(P)(+) transhydrogenase subunit alpha [Actinomyces sp. zg-332]|uniref:Re/Si-specific NAD(P)(+) transhydrogenase subunit alpha n=1 Tax=Actinomyces sp. zg-332 TaxID=2708340 RepID=UPI001422D01F|nr:Re/Si-specific NAD(P)(+) transhydrogenase subunit alpha [Actinomyces sp. zg-332]QPK94133.1 Re/Si-specific NAD(P)(+) transhydrogenase subunit alpha [Actinomyces sp. zg-332]